jgi:hypothetical protein
MSPSEMRRAPRLQSLGARENSETGNQDRSVSAAVTQARGDFHPVRVALRPPPFVVGSPSRARLRR